MATVEADWTDPNPFQLEALHEALLFAFPDQMQFSTFLLLKLGKDFHQIAPVFGIAYRDSLLQILLRARAEGWLDVLFKKARAEKPGSPKLALVERTFGLTSVEVSQAADTSLEDLVRVHAGFADLLTWTERLDGLASRVCRIEYPVGKAVGTGWLVGKDLVLTNWHVVRHAISGDWDPTQFRLRFDYAVTDDGANEGITAGLAAAWCLDNSPAAPSELGTGAAEPSADTLDYALLRLSVRSRMITYSFRKALGLF